MLPLLACVLVLAAPGQVATGGRLTGTVSDADAGTLIAGAKVGLSLAMDREDESIAPPQPRQTTTDAKGTFAFDNVQPGKWLVIVEKTGFARYPDLSLLGTDDRMTVDTSHTMSPLDIRLHKAAVIAGRIVNKSGEPEAELQVSALKLMELGGSSELVPIGNGQTNDIGEFRIAGLAAGDYLISASPHRGDPFDGADAAASTTLATTYFPGTIERSAARTVSVQAGETVPNLDFTIATVEAFSVSGIAMTSAGAPSPNAMVMLMPDLSVGILEPMMRTAGQDGTFTFAGVASGRYRITAEPGNAGGGGLGGFSMSVSETSDSSGPGALVTVAKANITGLKVIVSQK